MLKSLPRKEVEQYIANKTCDKFKKLPNYFLIEIAHRKRRKKMKKYEERTSTERVLKWDWIRNKRSINYDGIESKDCNTNRNSKRIEKSNNKNRIQNKNKIEESNQIVNAKYKDITTNEENKLVDSIKFIKEDNEYFEELERDKFGIYRSKKKRRKRADDFNELETGMRNLTFSSKPNESYVMLGDTVIIQCASNKINVQEDNELRWLTDRKDMLTYDNVIVDGPKLMIKEVEARNLGEYTCKKGNTAQRKVRLTIITLPKFKVVFNPVYVIDQTCTYDDLRAVQLLGPMMGKEICSEDQLCGVQIVEPVCLQDRVSSTAYVRMTAKMSVLPGQGVECSARCRRDLHDSLALMAAADAPALAAVKVMIMYDDMNKTLVPSSSSDSRRTIITHTLRRKDSDPRHDYYSPSFYSESINVFASCPAGYYLIPDQKLCAACPFGSWSDTGENSCAPKRPAHNENEPQRDRFRRCYWWWYPNCGWCVAGWAAAFACAGAVAVAHARGGRGNERGARGRLDVSAARAKPARARPLSPSRVILAKFFKSRSSTKATDSQETKFGLWKEKNLPPPLPPIDFDL